MQRYFQYFEGEGARIISRFISFVFLSAVFFALTACNPKAISKPRSQVLEEAREAGMEMPSIAEERTAFFSEEESQHARLLTLLRGRSSGNIRDSNYRFGAGDEVELNVFDVPELNVSVKVRESGFVNLPLIGALQVVGKTESEVHDELTKRLATFVRNPQINVFVSQFGSQKVAVMGAVKLPGTYPLKKGANTLLELLSQAGGVNEKAGNFINFIPSELSGIRNDNEIEARAQLVLGNRVQENRGGGVSVYLDQVLGTNGDVPLEIPVRGGDMIIVPEAGKVIVEGEIQRVGPIDLTPQTTLLGALAAAGGITSSAKIDEVEVVRSISGDKKVHLVLDLAKLATGEDHDVRIRNGDIVRVPSDSSRRMKSDTFEGIKKFINFGIGGTIPLP